ncbi:MAG TPA: sigma-70 family RNA polymerase sigma factor [Thermoanaerobaculia bacterium]|nr:sigma-70 family RNA polymerase sigma factor [Thermoanaerobaculia bacterium]
MPRLKKRRRRERRREDLYEGSWEELVSRYGRQLRALVAWSLLRAGQRPEPDQVEDRVQEVYCRLLVGGTVLLRRFRRWGDGRVVQYLARTAQGVVCDELRAALAVKRGAGLQIAFAGRLAELADQVIDSRGTPEEAAIFADARRVLLARCRLLAATAMDPEDRQRNLRVLRWALLEGWSSQEIVRAEGGRLATSTVDTLVHRARRRILEGTGLPSRAGAYLAAQD